jgi:YVTN family beta-propeller protein
VTVMVGQMNNSPKISKLITRIRMVTKPVSVELCGNMKGPNDATIRRNWRRYRSRFFLLTLCALLFVVVGCASLEEGQSEYYGPNDGQITIYINGPETASLDITFDLSAVQIVSDSGVSKEILTKPLTINSLALINRQMLLGETALPEGRYEKLRLTVKGASIKRKEKADLALPPEGIEIPISVTMTRNQNTTLFLKWDADASIAEGYQFKPAFMVRRQRPELSTLLVYVTNEDSNNVSVINRQTDEVVATVMVGKKPRGIATGLRRQHIRIYVANSKSNSVSVIDPTTNTVETEIPIRFGQEPEGIAVATVSPDREFIIVTNYGSNNVSVIDGITYQEMQKINVGNGPIAVDTDPPVETIARDTLARAQVLSFEDAEILRRYRQSFLNTYVANRNSREVTVLKMDVSTGRIIDTDTISLNVDWNPIALDVDFQRGRVYVANYGFDNLSVISIPELIKGDRAGAVTAISGVGHSNIGVVADPSLDRIYLLKEIPGEVLIIRPMLEEQTPIKTVTPIVGTIAVGSAPRSLMLDPEARKLYVVNRGSQDVSVIDKATSREEKTIPVGKKPYGIAMIPF